LEIIKKVFSKAQTLTQHILDLNIGQTPDHKSSYYEIDGKSYTALAGSIGWPYAKLNVPGWVIIVGVVREDNVAPQFEVLEAYSNTSASKLLSMCLKLRTKYDHDPENTLSVWHADPEPFESLTSDLNVKLQKKFGQPFGFFVSYFYDSQRKNCFEIYANRINQLLQKDKNGRKRLIFTENSRDLANSIKKLPFKALTQSRRDEYPGVFALGGMLHDLLASTPWQKEEAREEYLSNPHDILALEVEEEQKAWDLLFGVDLEEEYMESYANDDIKPI